MEGEKMNRFTLTDFVKESNRIEGISSTNPMMLDHDIKAHEDFLTLRSITVADLEWFVSKVQPGAVLRRKLGMNVRVGDYVAPDGGDEVEWRLEKMLRWVSNDQRHADPFAMHLKYENIHPFTDGNGRSGRALWLWMMGGIENAPLGFLHTFYYQTLKGSE